MCLGEMTANFLMLLLMLYPLTSDVALDVQVAVEFVLWFMLEEGEPLNDLEFANLDDIEIYALMSVRFNYEDRLCSDVGHLRG